MKKRTIFCVFALLQLFPSINIFALTPPPDTGEPIDLESEGYIQPRSVEPDCYYLDGYVYINCDNSVTSISGTVIRLSDNAQWSNSSNRNTLQIPVPTSEGTYRLSFSLSDGSSYYGEYSL